MRNLKSGQSAFSKSAASLLSLSSTFTCPAQVRRKHNQNFPQAHLGISLRKTRETPSIKKPHFMKNSETTKDCWINLFQATSLLFSHLAWLESEERLKREIPFKKNNKKRYLYFFYWKNHLLLSRKGRDHVLMEDQ